MTHHGDGAKQYDSHHARPLCSLNPQPGRAPTQSELESFAFTMTLSEPDPAITFEAPASFVDVPVATLLGELFSSFGSGDFIP
jgi:hypothetical protein